MTTENKLSTLISDHSLPLGNTETGKAWALKALHPSDPITTTRGIPDESSVPSVFMNYQSTYVIEPPADANPAPWSFDMTVTPHPVSFACYDENNANGQTNYTSLLNTQLAGNTHAEKFTSFRSMCDRWRVAYMSVTIQQDAPALADQGSIAACQTAYAPVRQNFSYQKDGFLWSARPLSSCTVGDKPSFDKIQSMPGAYFTKSKEGCYMPIKLTRTCQNWRSDTTNTFVSYSDVKTYENGTFPLPTSRNPEYYHCYPFYYLEGVSYNPVTSAFLGDVTSDMCNDAVGHISVRNVAPTTRFTVFVRAGFELQVLPGTVLTPQQMLSPEHDGMALDTYFAISRKLKDAYPADYNDLGKIWSVIKTAAKAVLPVLKNVPGIPGLIANGLDTALGMGEAIQGGYRSLTSAVDKKASASLANLRKGAGSEDDREIVQDYVNKKTHEIVKHPRGGFALIKRRPVLKIVRQNRSPR